jgi:hypothetical protein
MAFKVRNRDEALALVEALKQGKIKPEAQEEVKAGLQRFGEHFQRIQTAKAEGRGMTDEAPRGETRVETALNMLGERGIGNLDAAGTIISGMVAEPVAGFVGLVALGGSKGTSGGNDTAVAVINSIRDALTWNPKTVEGQEALQTIAAPLKKLDDAADYIATTVGMGNPVAQTLLYTGIIGGLMGIDLKQTKMPSDVIRAAGRMVPEERFARTAELQEALQLAEVQMRTAKRKAEGVARAKNATIKSNDVADFVNGNARKEITGVRQNLEAEFDITGSDFKVLQERLTELQNLTKTGKAPTSPIELPPGVKLAGPTEIQLRGLQTIHDRITKTLISRKRNQNTPRIIDENVALVNLQKQLDGFMDNAFNKDMIRGDADALAKWRQAGEVRQKYNKQFHEDRTIMQFLNDANSPADVHRWLLGANAVRAKPQAARVIRRMQDILGKDSRAIKGLKQEIAYDLAKPLLQDHPNFEAFVRGVDTFIADQSGANGLIRTLGMETAAMGKLRNFAAAALKTPEAPGLMSGIEVTKNMSRLLWGHGIAKAGVRVNLGTAFLGLMSRKGKLSRKEMIFKVGEAMFNEPMINPSTRAAGQIIQGAAITNVQNLERQADNETLGQEE